MELGLVALGRGAFAATFSLEANHLVSLTTLRA